MENEVDKVPPIPSPLNYICNNFANSLKNFFSSVNLPYLGLAAIFYFTQQTVAGELDSTGNIKLSINDELDYFNQYNQAYDNKGLLFENKLYETRDEDGYKTDFNYFAGDSQSL